MAEIWDRTSEGSEESSVLERREERGEEEEGGREEGEEGEGREKPTHRLKTSDALVPLEPLKEALEGLPDQPERGGPTSAKGVLALQ